MIRDALNERLREEGAEVDETKPIRVADAREGSDDAAIIVQLRDGRYCFAHVQASTRGLCVVTSPDLAVCEGAARRALHGAEPSTVGARLGLSEEPRGEGRVR